MNKTSFADLIVGYCKLCGIDGPMDIVHGTPVQTGNVLFSLIHSERIDPRLILIYGDVGTAPQSGDTRAYHALLLRNFHFSARRGPAFSISPDSGRLMLVQAEALTELTPSLLADRLEELAEYANQWRKHSFDSEPDAASGPTASPLAGLASVHGSLRGFPRR